MKKEKKGEIRIIGGKWKGKKIYFASDNHLGAPNLKESKIRESLFLKWLNQFKKVKA